MSSPFFTLDWEGRQQEDLNCCDSLLLSALSPDSPALAAQDEKFGVYRLQYVDRSATGRGRATFKHIERDLFLFYVRENTLSGWIVGPQPGLSSGGLFVRVRTLLAQEGVILQVSLLGIFRVAHCALSTPTQGT